MPKIYEPNTLSSVFNDFNLLFSHLLNAPLSDIFDLLFSAYNQILSDVYDTKN